MNSSKICFISVFSILILVVTTDHFGQQNTVPCSIITCQLERERKVVNVITFPTVMVHLLSASSSKEQRVVCCNIPKTDFSLGQPYC